jgi:serine/threonine-protein kinase
MSPHIDADRWQELQSLFQAAKSLEADAREQLLIEHARKDAALVAELRALLAADSQPGILDAPAPRFASVSGPFEEPPLDRVGAYRVVREIGRGGMGVVYLAERADGQFQHRVAIKLIETSDEADPLHQRFLAERQILAGLIHPNITRLLDGGVTDDDRPYLVMEYVDGLPITTYCERHRLDFPARLTLFADVCAAVQHAHQKLVIHRDLKPSNILVSTDGRVHLLDFGIAKLLNPALGAHTNLTRAEWRVMTPEFASPEQVRGDVLTTSSDVYSLGVLLYQLLTGHSPYQLATRSPMELAAAVCDQEPEKPSTRASSPLLEGDLDGIVLMAMRKEPSRRYASADMLRQDIERHLTGLPVLAHRGSRRYRAATFLRRHRIEATAAGLVLLALVSGLSVALVQSRRASRERDRAERALGESEGVTNFLMELFRTGDADDQAPAQLSAAELLQRGAERANELADQPVAHARLLDVIGQMSYNLGRLDEAQRRLEQAVTIRRATLGDTSVDLAKSLIHLSWIHRARNDYEAARKLVSEASNIRRATLSPEDPFIAEGYYELGWLAFGPEQERLYRQALAALPDSPTTAERRVTFLQALSTNLRRQGQLTQAVETDREALRTAEAAFGPEHHATAYAMIHLGDHVRDIEQDVAGAERLYRRGLELTTRQFGGNSVRLIHGLNSLASLLSGRGDAQAEGLYRRALAIRQSATSAENPQVADQKHRLARELARQGRLSEAESLVRQALDLSTRTLGARHPVVTDTRLPLLAEILALQGRHAEADRTYGVAFEQTVSHGVVPGEMRREYGRLLLRRGDHTRAERQLLQSLALLEDAYRRADHPNVFETRRSLMELYQRLNKPELVERYRVPPGRYIPY